jgi:hypothetical protein
MIISAIILTIVLSHLMRILILDLVELTIQLFKKKVKDD